MLTISCNQKNKDEVILCVTGRIDTLTAEEFGKTVSAAHAEEPEAKIILNFEKVEIISSYGLRELLQFTKQGIDYKLTNVNADVFSVLKLSGFLNYIEIEKPLKQLSLEGCEMIGKGANAEVFRLNDEQVVKIFKRAPDIDQIILSIRDHRVLRFAAERSNRRSPAVCSSIGNRQKTISTP